MVGHFMKNMYALEIEASTSTHNIRLSQRAKEDTKIHIEFFKQAEVEISMNLLTYRIPNHTILGDACEHGLGAFQVESGRAWAHAIPDYLQGRAHIIFLEFLNQVIQIWLNFIEGRIANDSYILTRGDNTASMGWMRRSNFREEDENNLDCFVIQQIARKLSRIILKAKACLYSQ